MRRAEVALAEAEAAEGRAAAAAAVSTAHEEVAGSQAGAAEQVCRHRLNAWSSHKEKKHRWSFAPHGVGCRGHLKLADAPALGCILADTSSNRAAGFQTSSFLQGQAKREAAFCRLCTCACRSSCSQPTQLLSPWCRCSDLMRMLVLNTSALAGC